MHVHYQEQWRSQYRGKGGQSGPLASDKIVKNRDKEGKNGKREEKSRKKRKNWEEETKIGKVHSPCPS